MFSFPKNSNQKDTIWVLDGVRAIACLLVVSFHLNQITIDAHIWKPYPVTNFFVTTLALQGASGVTLFFVLSGFLLFMPYARALLFEQQWPSMRRFYLRRILRIWPAYYVSLFLIIWLFQPQYLQPEHLKDLGLFLVFFMDSTSSTFQKINGPFWTLAVEWQFYMLLPFLALGFGWIIKRLTPGSLSRRWWTLTTCLCLIIAWGVFSRYWGLYFYTHPAASVLIPRVALNVPLFFLYGADGKFLEDFAAGMLISCFYVVIQQGEVQNELYQMAEKIRRSSPQLFVAGLGILLIMALWNGYQRFHLHISSWLDMLGPQYNWLGEVGLSIGFALCVAALLFGSTELRRPFEWAPLRWIGLLSYSMYIWHLPLLIQLTIHSSSLVDWNRALAYTVFWLFVLLGIIPFCFIFYKIIEHPWIKLGDRLLKKRDSRPREILRENLGREP